MLILCGRTFSFYPVKLGDYVTIGAGSVVEAASVGNMVQIGRDCVVGSLCVIRDCVRIEDGSVVAPGTTIPSFCIYSGCPGWSCFDLLRGFDFLY
jgi:dynactin-5